MSRSIVLITIALALLLAGCGGGLMPTAAQQPAQYLLEGRGVSPRPNLYGPCLSISAVRSAAGFGAADMLYITHSHQLQAFANHRWVDTPARMLEPLLVAMAEGSGGFSQVVGPGSRAKTRLRLDSQLLRLVQVFDDSEHSRIELALRATLIENASGRILTSRVIQVEVPAEQATPYGGVLAANRATELMLDELRTTLITVLELWGS